MRPRKSNKKKLIASNSSKKLNRRPLRKSKRTRTKLRRKLWMSSRS